MNEPKCINCKATLRWERDGGEWKPNTYDSNVAIRCLDCASLLCGPCGKSHFEESGLLATSKAALAASQAEVSALRAERDRLKDQLFGARGNRRAADAECAQTMLDLRARTAERDTAAASLERARLAMGFDQPYSVLECLSQLADAADHLLKVHDCDAHGWEGVGIARDAARKIAVAIGVALAPPTPIATPGTEPAFRSICELVDCRDQHPHNHEVRCLHLNPGDGSCDNCRCADATPGTPRPDR